MSIRFCLSFLLCASVFAAEEQLVEKIDVKALDTRDVTASEIKDDKGQRIHLAFGHNQTWPGITLKAPNGHWDLARFEYVSVDVKNVGAAATAVFLRVDNEGANGSDHCNTEAIHVAPGETKTLTVKFKRNVAGALPLKLFGMNGYPAFMAVDAQRIDPSKINQVLIFMSQPSVDNVIEIANFRTGGTYVAPKFSIKDAKEFFPFIDEFGQYIHEDWPGKTHSLEELKKRATEEVQKPAPADWDEYGGWKDGPKLEATGHFRTAKHEGRWWLVDPNGKLFFSHGIDCVRFGQETPVDDRADWFKDFPGEKPEFKAFEHKSWGATLHGYYKGKTPMCFDFNGANLLRKFGADWKKTAAENAHTRLKTWGLNTIGNWSDEYCYLMKKTPYVVALGVGANKIAGSSGFWGQFVDPFDPTFKENFHKRADWECKKHANDPYCIGYFVDNELAWGDDTSLASATVASPADQAAKKEFLADLRKKYDSIEKLNAAWGTQHASWDEWLSSKTAPDKNKAHDDLAAFYTRIAEAYFKQIKDELKAAAPKKLYLGCRFAGVNNRAAEAAAKFCDVVSYNLYSRSVAGVKVPGELDMPIIVGEFHFGALDRGMFHTGLVPTDSQAARAAAYRDYVISALKNPNIVGCHWFQFQDEPTTGRALDGENYQIGFIDNVDTPYPETIETSRAIGETLYKIRTEK